MLGYKIAIVGVTGMVGQTMLKVMEERNFPVRELLAVASERSVGKKIIYSGRKYQVISISEAVNAIPDIAIFSAGESTSLKWAPAFAEKGCIIIDNSSAWRMNDDVPLVIPEININAIKPEHKIIANPNCSTIQLLMAIAPLHKQYIIKRLVVSTYQSVSGTGVKATEQLNNEIKGIKGEKVYPHPIFMNCLPHCGAFLDDGYTREEIKLHNETRKILSSTDIQLTATAVRVPVMNGHSESVNVEFENEYELKDISKLLGEFPGLTVMDDPSANLYPMPVNASGSDEVFVGRIRRDFSRANSLNLWIVSDNIRKGAASNAIQIAEHVSVS